MKICFIASSGGHWEELMCLREIAAENDCFFVTEKGGQAEEFGNKYPIYVLEKIDRKEKHFLKNFFRLFRNSKKILREEEPDVVITTGALLAYPFCVRAKFMKKKVIYIESFARINELSLTGKLVYRLADDFVVQWPSLKEKYKKAKYFGGIF